MGGNRTMNLQGKILTPELAATLLKYLARVTLQAREVDEFRALCIVLQELVKPPEPAPEP